MSSAAQNLILQAQERTANHSGLISAEVGESTRAADKEIVNQITHHLITLAGVGLFGCAILAGLKIINLEVSGQLQQPAIDLGICAAIAFLGGSISWVQLGDKPRPEHAPTQFSAGVVRQPTTVVAPITKKIRPKACAGAPLSKAIASTERHSHSHVQAERAAASVSCRYCGQKMMRLGRELYLCWACRTHQNRATVSFLDAARY